MDHSGIVLLCMGDLGVSSPVASLCNLCLIYETSSYQPNIAYDGLQSRLAQFSHFTVCVAHVRTVDLILCYRVEVGTQDWSRSDHRLPR